MNYVSVNFNLKVQPKILDQEDYPSLYYYRLLNSIK